MLQRFLLITLTLCSLTASAQWQQTGSKVRYVNGLGIPTKDTAAGVSADSSQIVIRPQDSALYIKYKRTWIKVGGNSVSGTTNRVLKFTGATSLGNSSIVDSASAIAMTINPSGNVGIGTASPASNFVVSNAGASGLEINPIGGVGSGVLIQAFNRNTLAYIPQSYYALSHTFNVGTGGATRAVDITAAGNVGIGTTAPAAKLAVSGTTLINTNTDNGVDKLQVSGGLNVSAGAKAQSLSVTNDIDQGSGIANAKWTILANGTSSGWAGRMLGDYATGQFYFQHRNNTPTFTTCFSLNANSGIGGTTFFDNAFIEGQGFLTVNASANNGVDKLLVNGSISGIGMKQAYASKTAAYTATTSDYFIDCTSGSFTVTLYAASGNAGRILIIKNSGAGTITVDGNASETIDGSTTKSLLVQYDVVQIMCDGTNWKIISNL